MGQESSKSNKSEKEIDREEQEEDMEILIPTKKLKENLRNIHDKSQKKAILVSTGAMCPVHKMHVEIMNRAKEYLEFHHKKIVIAGYLSPSNDRYVTSKMNMKRISSISGKHRCEIARLSTRNSMWLDVSEWESAQKFFVDFPSVTKFICNHICENVIDKDEKENIEVYFVCGSDLVERTGMHEKFPPVLWCDGIISISRPESGKDKFQLQSRNDKLIHLEVDSEDISSSQVRDLMLQSKDITHLVGHDVVQYMKENNVTFQNLSEDQIKWHY